MSKMTNLNKTQIVSIIVAIALVGSLITLEGNMAFAKKSNYLDQAIVQPQKSHQSAQCASGTVSLIDCNNIGLVLDSNTGNESAAQR